MRLAVAAALLFGIGDACETSANVLAASPSPTTVRCPTGTCPLAPRGPSVERGAAPVGRVVRVANQLGGERSIGSGCLVDCNARHGLVLTCGHLFREGTGEVVVTFRDGRAFGARVLGVDLENDLAAVFIRRPSDFGNDDANSDASWISANAPLPGDMLTYCGYGPAGRLVCRTGRLDAFVSLGASGGAQNAEALQIAGAARQGDSGGPVFNAAGEVVGVIVATDGRRVIATGHAAVRRFLAPFVQRFSESERPVAPDRASPKDVEPDKNQAEDNNANNDGNNDSNNHASAGDAPRHVPAKPQAAGDSRGAVRPNARDAIGARINANDWIATLIPIALGALGITLPPTTAWIAWKVFRCCVRRRLRKRRSRIRRQRAANRRIQSRNKQPTSQSKPMKRNLNDDYAAQLAEVFSQSGRSPIQDATLGREYSEELSRAASSSDAKTAQFARNLRDKVERKFHRIHGFAPSPAEPVE